MSSLLTLLIGCFPLIFVPRSDRISQKEGYCIVVGAWVVASIVGMFPYLMWGGEFSLINAWFESVSGYTTTGSTILSDVEALPKSLVFWRSSTHYIGGLGVVVFLLLVMPDASPYRLKLTNMELSSLSKEGYRYKSGTTARVMIAVYAGLTLLETLCLWAAGMSLFDAINHAFSTVATGGFSTKNTSVMYFDSTSIDIIITVFMALSAMHFGVIFAIVAGRSFKPLKHSVTKYYLGIIAVCSIIIAFSLKTQGGYESWGGALLDSTFQTVSYLTTTGFGQADNAMWPLLANTILIFAAMHCGCAGSTTGGIKADRMFIALKAIHGDFLKRLHPSSLFRTRVGGKVLNDSTVSSVFLYIVLYIIIIFISFILLLICGVEIGDAFSGTISSLGNVGPGTGTLGTMGNYSGFSPLVKFIFTIDMFFGRVEIFPILIVISMIFKRQK